jgi:sterol desaturase/sphingolipid hydroxylase (fatty acid hydroxylase superfamily)
MFPTTESTIRLASFGVVLLLMMGWELLAPKRRLTTKRPLRWASNLGLVIANTLLARLITPFSAVGMALVAQQYGWGLLHWLAWPAWLEIVLAVIALDLAIYLQHVMFHAVPLFWRLHLVHHADLDIDVTTGLRFHTLEILLSMGIKVGVVAVLGPAASAVVIFEVLLNATSMFNHSNVQMPAWLDRILRLLVVTPDMHRVHHSVLRRETNSNFGFNLPWWDYLLGTYRAQPQAGHEGMTIGLSPLRDERQTERLDQMLLLPWSAPRGDDSPEPTPQDT